MQSELKPCPFCGGDAEYHSDKGPTGEVYGWVGCNQCDAMSVHCDVRSMQPEETHPIDAWNTRASDAEITRLTEALRAAEEREAVLREALFKATPALSTSPNGYGGRKVVLDFEDSDKGMLAYEALSSLAFAEEPSHD